MMQRRATEERIGVDGVSVFVRRTDGDGEPVVFVHGNPTNSSDWIPFLERLERPAIAYDVPGWGGSDRPRDFDYSMHGLASFHGRVLERLGIDRHALVVHDWGAIALIDAAARPERVERLTIINAVPLLPGYRWHWIARWFWRVPVAGELFNLGATRSGLRAISRQATARPGPLPEEFVDGVWKTRQSGVGRPTLTLYRSADPDALAAAGYGLDRITAPALVAWGVSDPYLPRRFGRAYADRLPGATLLELSEAGHWPWIDRPALVGTVTDFLTAQ